MDEFASFYADNKDRCLRAAAASGMAPQQAEDAVAEAFARAWARWRSVRSHDCPAAWVVRTATNANISWWRRHRHERLSDLVPEPMTAGGAIERTDLIAAIRRLPPRQRDVVIHRYLLDLDTAATASHLGIAPGTVTAHLHHALAALRQQMTEQHPQSEGTHA